MRITNEESLRASQITPVAPVAGRAATTTTDTATAASPAASVELSAQAQAMAAAKAEAARFVPAVNAAPDTRDALVNDIKARVDAGTYNVSSADIADQMIRRAQADRIR